MTAIVELKNATKIVTNGFDEEKIILNDVSLDIYEHDFITILGGNGAGKIGRASCRERVSSPV